MTQLNELRILNNSTILYLKKINKNYDKNIVIKNILSDDACFFKMEKDDAYLLLKNVGIINEELENVYKELISRNEFYKLLQYKKIDINDENLIIKYPLFNSDNPFKTIKKEDENKDTHELTTTPNKTTFIQKCINTIKKLFKK